MENISKELWKEKLAKEADYVLLDVRTPQECAEGIQQGAIQLNIMDSQSFRNRIESLDKSKTYFVYCRSGNRSGQACQILDQLGFNKTYNLLGGMMSWDEPTVSPN